MGASLCRTRPESSHSPPALSRLRGLVRCRSICMGMKDQQMSFAIGLRPSTPSVLWNATLLTTVHSHCPTTCSVRRTSRQASDRKAT
ncbi:hypothetical protein CMEL01_05697 [Colletotrichum melonis]|uniref:Uncharacterized protein n=2 Tax=Colletotrichum acutatum species complex TaxID=2707335 RepID=A0AAI9U937_9PEZI|nr:hypothetical protein CLIM01_00660 [Colletotrichum limetticola]KAK1454038.1 hypothetical protein CMEL01_05697 [Colletotrichum melonis]